jgi:signal transduction histidine kinase
VNPSIPPTPEPVVSLPIGAVGTGLLLVVGMVILTVLVLKRHGESQVSHGSGIGEVSWLAPLLDSLPQAALVVGPDGHPLAWNAMAAYLLSLDAQAEGLPLSLAAMVTRVLDSKTVETTEVSVADRQLRATASPLRAVGCSFGALVLVQDPTETTRSAESYRRLISAVSHELRTPLTAILGHANILDACDPERDRALWRRSRGFIARETERLARLVEDLLTLSRLDSAPLQRQPTNLRAVAEEALSTLFQVAESNGVRLSLQSPPNVPRVLADRDRLHQVFLNLVDNAIKYSSAGGETVVRLEPEGDHVHVEVHDDGVGIAAEDLHHIFEPLYRGKDVRDRPGTGLGLTIVRTILEQHGSTIGVESAPHRGTVFRFSLPCAPSSQPRLSTSSQI